jgi:Prokaryotic homologs of the JAB domain
MRAARAPLETGGVLFGLVDIPTRSIHLVDASPAPPDSVEARDGFQRGLQGVDELLESVRHKTARQVRYIGEWHSHPPRMSARPSPIDARQLDWLAPLLEMDSMPALMLIAADRELGIIFAQQQAELLTEDHAA